MLQIFWKQVKKANFNLKNLIEFEKGKYESLKSILKERYKELKVEKDLPGFFESSSEFFSSTIQEGVLVGKIMRVQERETYVMLDVIDTENLYHLKVENPVQPLIEGIHLGFHVVKSKGKNFSTSFNLLEDVVRESKYRTSCKVVSYFFPRFGPISWDNKSSNKVVLLSDIHVGSMTFCNQNFLNLMTKIAQDTEIKYVLMNGDLVDGLEVYPGHKNDLEIQSYIQQYEALKGYLILLRPDITVVLCPGNHDFVSKVEPQEFPDTIKKIFASLPNVVLMPNPSYFAIDGIYFYMTHGTSYNSILGNISSLRYEECAQVTRYLADCRDVSPIRKAVPIAATEVNHHLIPEKVNVICSGHMHNQDVKVYAKNRLMVATGAWQQVTAYMALLGIKPDVSSCVVLSLGQFGVYEQWDLKDQTTESHSYQVSALRKTLNQM